MTSPSPASTSLRRPSRRLKLAALAILVLLSLVWMATAIMHRLTHVSAQDARIMAAQVTVSSRLPGWVAEFPITEGDRLKRGDTVARLYSEPEQRHLAALEAEADTMRAKVAYEQTRLALGEQQFQGGLTITDDQLNASKAAEEAAQSRLTAPARTTSAPRRCTKRARSPSNAATRTTTPTRLPAPNTSAPNRKWR